MTPFSIMLDALARGGPVLNHALGCYSPAAQTDMTIEEMAELTTALLHIRRDRDADVVTEIADVLIMVSQMALLYGPAQVAAEIARKVARLDERMR